MSSSGENKNKKRKWRSFVETVAGLLFFLSIPFIFVCIAQVWNNVGDYRSSNRTYVVAIKSPNDECGPELALNYEDGTPLQCMPLGTGPIYGVADIELPGFTDEQNATIAELAKNLGADGLLPSEQIQIQKRIDEFAATVPSSERPYPGAARRAWVWGGVAAADVLILVAIWGALGIATWASKRR
ncbi:MULTISPECIES: hypothetical protein [unclassified Parafrankia]|uniref:hypothetical protein n=1 Tax=unclassified Parafrankia TaxID=2994368 RepID=UPI000DA4EC24|nr:MULTISPECIES: hypothetical protein [unclassified Parafrankia]TCJ32947.1 hypothetical protein E0504_39945 [Parafrankia sp. BMG5.11]SQD99666.1 hypothetical protein FMEAI12_5510012 [Parafrankia sp. Ea1.12]